MEIDPTIEETKAYIGMWETEDGNIRHELLLNGRYDEARGTKESAYQGASSGIGAGVAKMLADKGVRVGLAARRTDKLQLIAKAIEQSGGEAHVLTMDVADKNSVHESVAALKKAFGGIDILVNNAGLMPAADIDTFKTDEWIR